MVRMWRNHRTGVCSAAPHTPSRRLASCHDGTFRSSPSSQVLDARALAPVAQSVEVGPRVVPLEKTVDLLDELAGPTLAIVDRVSVQQVSQRA
jgi:hypothetical protein